MNNSKKMLLAAVLLVAFSFPARSGSIGTQISTCSTGVFNDFAPTNEFGSCWSIIGNVTSGLPGVGPTIATSGGTSMTSLQNFVGTGFQFSNFTSDSIGIGSAIQDNFTLAGTRQLSVSFTNSSPAGSIGFAIIGDQSNSYRFVTLFDMPSGGVIPFGLGPAFPSLAAGTYKLTIGIANATQPCGLILSTCLNAAAPTTGPQITSVNIQDLSAPEPAAGWLLASGLAGLAIFRRRTFRSN